MRKSYFTTVLLLNDIKKVGAEIGVSIGNHALVLLSEELHVEKLYLVDPYLPYNEVPTKDEQARLRRIGHGRIQDNRAVWIDKPSVEAAKEVEEESLDFVYIDGGHTKKAVSSDIKAWLPKVKKGGIIGGHDFNRAQVTEGIEEVFSSVHNDGVDWWVYK